MKPNESDKKPLPAGSKYAGLRQGILPIIFAGGVMGIFQAIFLVWVFPNMLNDGPMIVLLLLAGFAIGFLTMIVSTPLIWFAGRWHPQWTPHNPAIAIRRVTKYTLAAIAGAMIGNKIASDLQLSVFLQYLFDIGAMIPALFLAYLMRPLHPKLIKIGARSSLALLLCIAIYAFTANPLKDNPTTGKTAPEKRPPDAETDNGRPDIVLITIDTLRADCLGTYGHPESLTPAIDRFASESIVFSRALAPAPWTVPSIASLMTGIPAIRHGAGRPVNPKKNFLRTPLDPTWVTTAEQLRSAGYATKAVVANLFLSETMGFRQGFDTYKNPCMDYATARAGLFLPLTWVLVHLFPVEKLGDPRAEGVTNTALDLMQTSTDAPLFLWVHYIDPHIPYLNDPAKLDIDPWPENEPIVGDYFIKLHDIRAGNAWIDEEDRRRLKYLYDKEVVYTDRHIARLLDAVRERSKTRNVAVVLTADHGEEFWDHGGFEHGHNYYRELTRVPLMFRGPGHIGQPRVINEPVGLVDVHPTLLSFAGLEVPAPQTSDQGISLTALMNGKDIDIPPRFSGGNLYDLPAVLVCDGPWRCILRANNHEELYDVDADPAEQHNLAFDFPDVADKYRKMLEPRLARYLNNFESREVNVDMKDMQGLKSLGYVQ